MESTDSDNYWSLVSQKGLKSEDIWITFSLLVIQIGGKTVK